MYLNCYEHRPEPLNYRPENKRDVKEFINSNFVQIIISGYKVLTRNPWIVHSTGACEKADRKQGLLFTGRKKLLTKNRQILTL
jgi:hypothetical protein